MRVQHEEPTVGNEARRLRAGQEGEHQRHALLDGEARVRAADEEAQVVGGHAAEARELREGEGVGVGMSDFAKEEK